MALTTSVKYLWPPDWDGDKQLAPPNQKRWSVQMQGLGTATEDESNVRKVGISDMKRPNGEDAERMVIDKVTYHNYGFTTITLNWDRSPNNLACYVPGNSDGVLEFKQGLQDRETGGTGDLLLTTQGGAAQDSYNIVVDFRLK